MLCRAWAGAWLRGLLGLQDGYNAIDVLEVFIAMCYGAESAEKNKRPDPS